MLMTASASGQAGVPLLPDLVPLALEAEGTASTRTIGIEITGAGPVLDVGFKAANIGRGPLEALPLPEPATPDDCDGDGSVANDRPMRQNVFLDGDGSGDFNRAVDTGHEARDDGCTAFHPGHGHWHTVGITTELRAEGTGAVGPGLDKYAFCLVDFGTFDETLPGYSDSSVYPDPGCGDAEPQGLSIGWYDIYRVGLAGQQINISGLAAGNYCVRQTVDGGNSIDEVSDANNSREIRISLNPTAASVAVLAGTCVFDPVAEQPPAVDTTAPQTRLVQVPRALVRTRRAHATVRFGFTASEPEARFECRLDDRAFAACASPFEARARAKRGRGVVHSFQVRATDTAGNADPSPAEWSGTVKRKRAQGNGRRSRVAQR
jgi:hypothetical protein